MGQGRLLKERRGQILKGPHSDRSAGMLVTTVVTQVSLFPLLVMILLLVIVGSVFLVGILLALRNRRKEPPGHETPVLVVLVVGLAAVTAALGFGAYETYLARNAWTFSYAISIRANGSSPASVVVPIPRDEGLLAGLQLTEGTANWSVVSAAKGRGLYVAFTGSAALRVDVAIRPPPSPAPDTGPTLEVPYVASLASYQWWVFYNGQAGGTLSLTLGCYDLQTNLVQGWTAAAPSCPNPQLPPLA
jgi:heme/copper-type cytochrome/quinol oxidase subunit 2